MLLDQRAQLVVQSVDLRRQGLMPKGEQPKGPSCCVAGTAEQPNAVSRDSGDQIGLAELTQVIPQIGWCADRDSPAPYDPVFGDAEVAQAGTELAVGKDVEHATVGDDIELPPNCSRWSTSAT